MANIAKLNEKQKAAEMMAFDPDISIENIAKELNNYVYADKGSKLYVDNYNHAIDGIRYNVIYHLDNPNAGRYYVQ